MTHPALVNYASTPTLSCSLEWVRLTADEKGQRIRATIEAMGVTDVRLVAAGLCDVLVRLTRPMRPAEYGVMLMALERNLRKGLGEPVELYCEFKADSNRLRRDVQMRIGEWRSRREEVRHTNIEER